MKKYFVTFILLPTLSLIAVSQDAKDTSLNEHTNASASAQHEHASSQRFDFEPEFENESVQVVRIKIGPHEKLPMHDLTPRVVVLLTDEDLRVTLPNGESREEHHKAGETMWLSAQRHAGENLSDKAIEFIAVIPRQK
jgi:quercetin dioxygenase-like cupin family protein